MNDLARSLSHRVSAPPARLPRLLARFLRVVTNDRAVWWREPHFGNGVVHSLYTVTSRVRSDCPIEVCDSYAVIIRVRDEQLIAGHTKSAGLVQACGVACTVHQSRIDVPEIGSTPSIMWEYALDFVVVAIGYE